MLLKRNIKDGVIEVLYESSTIVSSEYTETQNLLVITFKTGQKYVYEGVPVRDYNMFEIAESQGKVFNKFIKQYPFKKGDVVDVVLLKERLDNAKQDDVDSLAMEVVTSALAIDKYFTTHGSLDISQLKSHSNLITLYLDKIKKNE